MTFFDSVGGNDKAATIARLETAHGSGDGIVRLKKLIEERKQDRVAYLGPLDESLTLWLVLQGFALTSKEEVYACLCPAYRSGRPCECRRIAYTAFW
jgi:hypothetical protein